jgi:hypothetical protein
MNITDLSVLTLGELTAMANELADNCRLAEERGDSDLEWSCLESVLIELACR